MEKRKQEEGAGALSLPSYAYSPFQEGRCEAEKQELTQIRQLRIPDGIVSLGNYTFYGCRSLEALQITDSVQSIGGGSFTGCTALRRLEILLGEGKPSCIQDVVRETFHEMYVSIQFRESQIRAELIFPEYYEEGVENTPARILETHFHGSGYKYRQCFSERKVDFQSYDKLFPTAMVYEKAEILIPMAMGRLLWPYALTEAYQKAYEAYIQTHLLETCFFYIKREDWHPVFSYCAAHGLWEKNLLEKALLQASRENRAEIVSFLMEEKRRSAPKEKSFEL